LNNFHKRQAEGLKINKVLFAGKKQKEVMITDFKNCATLMQIIMLTSAFCFFY